MGRPGIGVQRASRSRRTVCCHCEARCGVVVEVDEDGTPTSITGDREHPLSRGFICVRGRAAIEYFSDARRLNVPLRRTGARGSGDFVQVTWDEALDDIASTLGRIAAESGPEAVGLLQGRQFGADGKFGNRLMNLFSSPNAGGVGLMCGGPQFVAGALTFGFGCPLPDVVPGVTQLVVIWGQHPSASSPLYWGLVRRAVDQGARLVVVDARPTLEARSADLWLQPRPASDCALALSLLHVVVAERLYDERFVAEWTHGFAELEGRLEPFSPEKTETMTGIAAGDVRETARLYATTSAATLSVGTPNGQGVNALDMERCLAILIAVTGKLDRQGCNWLLGPTKGVESEVTYDKYQELPQAQRARRIGADRFRLHGEGLEILSAEAHRVWHHIPYPISRSVLGIAHPIAMMNAILTGEPYPIRALILQHHNAVGAYNGAADTVRALLSDRLELVVVHELKMTPTAMLADYVLPAASWMEKPFLLSQGWGTPLVAGEQVLEPQHARKSDFDLCRDLGRRLGQQWPDTVEDAFDDWLGETGLTFQDLLDGDRVLYGAPERKRFEQIDPVTGAPYDFATPTRKIELASTVLESLGYDALPSYMNVERSESERLQYPLHLMTGGTRIDATHQDHRQVPSLRKRHVDPIVEIDPRTAAAIGAEDGDWLRIKTAAGEVTQRARLVPGLGEDRVSAERWWYPERQGSYPVLFDVLGSNVNALTDTSLDECDPAYGALPFRNAYCRIERAATQTG